MEPKTVTHPIAPLFDANSRILILGSFPSVRSRDTMFFYGHEQNRFWPLMVALLHAPVPKLLEEKKHLLLSNGIALWDCIASCTIVGSSDSSIRDVVPNDLSVILCHAPIEKIFCNGKAALKYYQRYIEPCVRISAQLLPSTSPANAVWSLPKLVTAWQEKLFEAIPGLKSK